MLDSENKRDDRDINEVAQSPSHMGPNDIVAVERRVDTPPSGARGEDRLVVSEAVQKDPAPDEPWMPTSRQFAAGLVLFGATGLGLASLGGVVGVVLIMALLAAVTWLLFRWASWE